MNKIRPNDTRYEIIKKFDDCMDEFFARTIGFCEEITRIAESDESNMKINTLALNLLEDLNLITQNAEFYENEIKWSMLDIRFDKHEEYKSKMEKDLIDFKHKVNDIIGNGGIGNDYKEFESDQNAGNESKAIVISQMNKISKQMANMCVLIFTQILQKVEKLELMFSELVALNVSRTDDDYIEIFNRTRKKFESTKEFKAFSNSYVQSKMNYHFGGNISNPIQIDAIIKSQNNAALEDSEIGTIWSSASNDPALAAELFVRRNLKHDREIFKFMKFRTEVDLLESYRIEANKHIFKIGKGSVVSNNLEFFAPYSEVRLEKAWNDIHKIMDDAEVKDWEWCALHHALSVKQRINNVDFWTFMKWINNHFNEEIITYNNYKNYRYNYFVSTYMEEWNIEKYRDYYNSCKDPKQRGNTFKKRHERQYYRIVDELYNPLLKVLSKP